MINDDQPMPLKVSDFPYRLGLPAWAFPGWNNTYFLNRPSILSSYASVFNAVEGNTTFYHVPDDASVAAWREAVDGRDFLFSFKLPRTLTHERRFAMNDLYQFLTALAPLQNHLGPLLIQFPQWVGMSQLRRLKPVFDQIAERHNAVVEVRHPEFFQHPELLEPLLDYYGFGRVILDSRPLYQGDCQHPDVLAAVHEKPDLPVLSKVYNKLAFVRLILHPDGMSNTRWLEQWSARTVDWLQDGIVPHIMIHCPNNQFCPLFAEQFHTAVSMRMKSAIPDFPPWPVPQQGQLL